jgi:acyl-CoA synthetase (AMP-forming)/AMP-acid ligase II
VVHDPARPLTAEDVIEHVRTRLAGFKKPRHVVFVDELPRTAATGRPQKQVLRDRFLAGKLA